MRKSTVIKENMGLKCSLDKYKTQNKLLKKFISRRLYDEISRIRVQKDIFLSRMQRLEKATEIEYYKGVIKEMTEEQEALQLLYNECNMIM